MGIDIENLKKRDKYVTLVCVDQGASGGWAFLYNDGSVGLMAMPDTPQDILNIPNYEDMDSVVKVYGERVGYHRMGNAASSSAKFARHCGHIEMALLAWEVSHEMINPKLWQAYLGALPADKTARKREIKQRMQALHPELKVTLKTADALAMLEWARHTHKI